tara:strand:+ start:1290 stop:1505 length:216 start_codon:yes stop_codon:yes gene_type:complete
MDNKAFEDYTCLSDYLMEPESPAEDWRPLLIMASMGFAEVVMEDEELSVWSTPEQMDAFVKLDIDEIIGEE